MTKTRRTVEPVAYSINEVLEAFPIGRTKLFALIASGQLRTITVGSRRLVPVTALHELSEQGTE